MPKELIIAKNDRPLTTSKSVAVMFDKEHKHVLRDIRELEDKVSVQFWAQNFYQTEFKNTRGQKFPEFLLTKDGFTMLAMGYTGKEAMQFKEMYINKFNEMERYIVSKNLAKMEFPALTENIKLAHDEPKHYHYSNECDLINRIVLGKTAKQFKEEKGIGSKETSIREHLTEEQIYYIEKLQKADVGMVLAIPDFQERKKALKRYYNMLRQDKEKAFKD